MSKMQIRYKQIKAGLNKKINKNANRIHEKITEQKKTFLMNENIFKDSYLFLTV